MKDYNGFSAAERQEVYNKQRDLGLIDALPQICSVCGGTGGQIMGHTEDYRNLHDLREICVECHMKLHARFSRPGAWIKLLQDIAAGKKPYQWKSTGQFFMSQKKDDDRYPELASIDPRTLGNEWYHKLPMQKINLRACDEES
jgi:hypothetical protein